VSYLLLQLQYHQQQQHPTAEIAVAALTPIRSRRNVNNFCDNVLMVSQQFLKVTEPLLTVFHKKLETKIFERELTVKKAVCYLRESSSLTLTTELQKREVMQLFFKTSPFVISEAVGHCF
jgi:hypothetical protein